MKNIDLSKYGITGTTEIVYNPSYETLFEEETKSTLEGYEKGQETELGAVNVMTGIYTGRSPKDKYIVVDEKMKTLKGVYCTNQGYADFRPIDILIEKDDYSIIANDTNQGVSRYDFIVLDGTTIKENQIIY